MLVRSHLAIDAQSSARYFLGLNGQIGSWSAHDFSFQALSLKAGVFKHVRDVIGQ